MIGLILNMALNIGVIWLGGLIGYWLLSRLIQPLRHVLDGHLHLSPLLAELICTLALAAVTGIQVRNGVISFEKIRETVGRITAPFLGRSDSVGAATLVDIIRSGRDILRESTPLPFILTLIGSSLIILACRIVTFILCGREHGDGHSFPVTAARYLLRTLRDIMAIVLSMPYVPNLYSILETVITLGGAAKLDPLTFATFLPNLLRLIYILLTAGTAAAMVVEALTDSGLNIAILGNAFALAIFRPTFDKVVLWGYLALILGIGLVLNIIRDNIAENEEDDAGPLVGNYLAGGGVLLGGVIGTLLLSSLYIFCLAV